MIKALKSKALDNLNSRILNEMQQNARISAAEIGRRVGLSTPAVVERISRMEENGIIRAHRTLLNYAKLGFAVQAYIAFKASTIKHDEFIKLAGEIPQIVECNIVTGSPGVLMKVVTSTTEELGELIEKFKKYGDTNTSVILTTPVDYRPVAIESN